MTPFSLRLQQLIDTRCACVIIFIVLISSGGLCIAQDLSSTPPTIREIPVPADMPDRWPKGDWEPVARDEYQQFLKAIQPRPPEPRPAWIERVEYSATFVGDTLRGGLLRATVRHRVKKPELISLEPLNLAVSALGWPKENAIWGTAPDGRTMLVVGRGNVDLTGQWTLKGRRLSRSVEFDVRIAPATVSLFRLRLPDDFLVNSTVGDVAGPEAADQNGWSMWQIHLGSHTRCRLTFTRKQKQSQVVQPLVFSSHDRSYVARQDGLQLQSDFSLEVVRAAVDRLVFSVPAEIKVDSVTYGTDLPLSWRQVKGNGNQRLLVELPDALLGRSRPIRIKGVAPPQFQKQWALPQITLRNAVLMTGRLNLKVETPLVLNWFETTGYRQTEMVSEAADGESFMFQQFDPNARLLVEIGTPRFVTSAHVISHANIGTEVWELTAEIQWQSRAGSTFFTRCTVPPEWEVTDVRPAPNSPGSGIANWDVTRDSENNLLLVVEFLESLEAENPKRIHVLARRLAVPGVQRVALPVVRPLDSGEVEMLFAVSLSPTATPILKVDPSFKKVTIEQIPDFSRDSPLIEEVEAIESSVPIILLGKLTGENIGILDFESTGQPIESHARVTLQLNSNELIENWTVQFKTNGVPVDYVLVYLTASGPAPVWELLGDHTTRLTADRIPSSRFTEWKLPGGAGGELWKIRLPSPQERQFRVRASRTRELNSTLTATLAFTPTVKEFQGTVELKLADDVHVDVEPKGLNRIDVAKRPLREPMPQQAGRRSVWNYHSVTDGMTLLVSDENTSVVRRMSASLLLRSLISAGNSDHIVHWARYNIEPSSDDGPFRFQLPLPAELISVRVNDGRKFIPLRQGGEYSLPPLSDGSLRAVELHYRTPSTNDLVRSSLDIVLPRASHTILRFDWEFAVPPTLQVGAEPEAVSLLKALPELSKTQRFFGPLGRPGHLKMFNPFRRSSWRALFGSSIESTKDREDQPDSEFAPQGWSIWRATAPHSPDMLTLEIWNRSRANLLAWIGLVACLLVGFTLRIRRVVIHTAIGACFLSVCMVVAWLAPPVYAQIAGGCLAGSVIATLIPRRLLLGLKPPVRDPEGIPLGSTVSLHQTAAVGLLIAVVLLATRAMAQQSVLRERAPTNRPEAVANESTEGFEVLIPVGPNLEPSKTLPFVYANKELIAHLRKFKQAGRRPPEYLITSAHYQLKVGGQKSVTMDAHYKIAVLSLNKTTRVSLPIKHANLGSDPCLVNEKRQPVLPDSNGGGFAVELTRTVDATRLDRGNELDHRRNTSSRPPVVAPKPVSHSQPPHSPVEMFDVKLRLYPSIIAIDDGGRLTVGIPAVAASRLSLDTDRQYPYIKIVGSRGELVAAGTSRAFETALGKTNVFEVTWSADEKPVRLPKSVDATVACLIEAHPTRMEFHYRVAYHVERGSVGFCTWQIPREFVVRKVVANELLAPPTVTQDDGPFSRLLIEFSAAQEEDFVVDATFTMPIRTNNERIRVPAIDLLGARTNSEAVKVTRNQVAVATTSDFVLKPITTETNDVTKINDMQPVFENWAREIGVREPQFAYQLEKPSELLFQLVALTPQRKVRMHQVGRIGKRSLEWTLTAEVETTRGAFLHRLIVDPRLQIDSISVKKDQVERLVRWSPRGDGDRVVLFLNGKIIGFQDIILRGSLPLTLATETKLPSIRFPGAELLESDLLLQHSADVVVHVTGADKDKPLEDQPADDDEFVLDRFQLSDETAMPRIRVENRDEHVHVDTVSAVTRRKDGQWLLATSLRFRDLADHPSRYRVRIPPELAGNFRLKPDDVSRSRSIEANGSVLLTLEPPRSQTQPLLVTVTANLPAAPNAGEWKLPIVEAVDAGEGEHFLLFDSSQWLLRSVNSTAHKLQVESVPSWIAGVAETSLDSPTPNAFQSSTQDWVLAVQPDGRPKQDARLPLVETSVWLGRNGFTYGETRAIIVSMGRQKLDFVWPNDLQLRALVLNEDELSTLAPSSGVLSVPLDATSSVQTVRIYWKREQDRPVPLLGTFSRTYPQPNGVRVVRSLMTFVPPSNLRCWQKDGFSKTDWLDHSLNRIEGLLETSRLQLASETEQPTVWEALLRQHQSVKENLEGDLQKTQSLGAEQRRRFGEFSEQIDLLSEANPSIPKRIERSSAFARPHTGLAANSHTLFGRVQEAGATMPFSVWIVNDALLTWILAAVGLLVIVPVVRKLVKPQTGEWFNAHQPAALALLGLIWWTCLAMSLIGLVLILLAALLAVRRRSPNPFSTV